MTGTTIREKLHNGERVYGTHVSSLLNPNAAAIAVEIELDFAFFCTEHMPLDRTEIGWLCRFYAAHGISPVVRVPGRDADAISMALDAGAEGIVVPYVETVAEVQQAVGAVRYRPIKGKLLRETLTGREELPQKTLEFLDRFNRDSYLIIGIESVEAMENLEQLITIDGVDGVFLGPHDITTSMGIPEEYGNPRFLDAVERVIRLCRRHSVGVGLHTPLLKLGNATLHRFCHAGLNWMINGADITVMRDAMNTQLRALRELAGDEYINPRVEVLEPSAKTCIG